MQVSFTGLFCLRNAMPADRGTRGIVFVALAACCAAIVFLGAVESVQEQVRPPGLCCAGRVALCADEMPTEPTPTAAGGNGAGVADAVAEQARKCT